MQRLEVNGAVRLIYGSLGVKRLTDIFKEKYMKKKYSFMNPLRLVCHA